MSWRTAVAHLQTDQASYSQGRLKSKGKKKTKSTCKPQTASDAPADGCFEEVISDFSSSQDPLN
jgi:hypothetical protein